MSEILFLTRNFPPLVGGMERLALESVKALSAEWAVELIGPRGCEQRVGPPVHAVGVAHSHGVSFLVSGAWHAIRLARSQDRLAVIGGSGLAAPLVLIAARRSGVPACCFVHGLDLVVGHPVYRLLCLPAIRLMDRVFANSRNTAELARRAGVEPSRIRVLHPGVSPNVNEPASHFLSLFPAANRRRLLLSVGRLLPRKGVVDFVDRVLPAVVSRHPDALLVVAGGQASDALVRADRELQRLEAVVRERALSAHVLITGYLDDQQLAALFAAATALVFPIKDLPGDVEGFGMVALEAASHGVPTIAFDAGGVADAVRDQVSGALIPAGDFAAMAEAVSDYLSDDTGDVSATSCREFARSFDWGNYGASLRGLVRQLIAEPTRENP